MNARRITSKLTEFQNKPSLTPEEAAELQGIIAAVADMEDGASVDLTLPGPTDVSIPVDVAEPTLTLGTVADIRAFHAGILTETMENRRRAVRIGLAAVAAIGAPALASAMGPAAAGMTLTILKTIQAARAANG